MGFHKRYLDESWVFSSFRQNGAEGVYDLYMKADAWILQDKTAEYISVVLNKDISRKDKLNLIETYMSMRFEGLIGK